MIFWEYEAPHRNTHRKFMDAPPYTPLHPEVFPRTPLSTYPTLSPTHPEHAPLHTDPTPRPPARPH